MFTKEQIAEIIREETVAVLTEQQVNEGPFDYLKSLKQQASDKISSIHTKAKQASVAGDIKKQIDALMKQNAATLAALQKLDTRAEQLGVPDEKLKTAIKYGQYLASTLEAEAAEIENAKPVTGPEPTAAPPVVGEPESPTE